MDIRQNIYSLTDDQLERFQAAVNAIKADGTYDHFTEQHHHSMHEATVFPWESGGHLLRNSAHRGPAFLPWHRYYCREFELALQGRDPSVTLPYWDWAADSAAGSAAPLWNTDPDRGRIYIGGDGTGPNSTVGTGPFAGWEVLVEWGMGFTRRPGGLRRQLGLGVPTLPTPADVESCIADLPVYDTDPWHPGSVDSFRNQLEGWPNGPAMHNRVHVWVGGDMGPGTSPNDPVFFLHHAFVDLIWARWQQTHPGGYLPDGQGPPGHNLHDQMSYLDSASPTPANCLDYRRSMGYIYDTDPPSVQQMTTELNFTQVMAGDVERRYALFHVRAAQPITFEVLPTGGLQAPYSLLYSEPTITHEPVVDNRPYDEVRIWFAFTADLVPGPAPAGSAQIRCRETGEVFEISLTGSTRELSFR